MSLVVLAGGGLALVAGGVAIWYFSSPSSSSSSSSSTQTQPEKKKGVIEKIADFLFGETLIDNATTNAQDLAQLPHTLITILKWVAICGGVLISLLLIVFTYRMAIGNTPDVAGGIVQLTQAIPQVRVAQMVSR